MSRRMCLVWRSITFLACTATACSGSATLSSCAAEFIAASGLRSSWLSMARNWSLARSAASSAAFSRSSSSSRSRTARDASRKAAATSDTSRTRSAFFTARSPRRPRDRAAAATEAIGPAMRRPMRRVKPSARAIESNAPSPMNHPLRRAARSTSGLGMARPTLQPLKSDVMCAEKASIPSTVNPRYQPSRAPPAAARNPSDARLPTGTGGTRATKRMVPSTIPLTQPGGRCWFWINPANASGRTIAVIT